MMVVMVAEVQADGTLTVTLSTMPRQETQTVMFQQLRQVLRKRGTKDRLLVHRLALKLPEIKRGSSKVPLQIQLHKRSGYITVVHGQNRQKRSTVTY